MPRASMKGQVSNELLVVVGFILIIMIPLLYLMFFKMEAINADLSMLQVHFSVARIAFLVNAVGYMGDGSAIITEIYIPPSISETSIGDHEVIFTLENAGQENDVVQPTAFALNLDEKLKFVGGGRYRIEIYNDNGEVRISPQPSPGET